MPATYDIGDSVKLSFTVRDEAGALIDATTAVVVTKPDGTLVTPAPTITHVSTGLYTAVVAPDAAGIWLYRWTATGTATTSEDGQFFVQLAAAANVYSTVSELKSALHIPQTDTADDDELAEAILTESREIDSYTQRHFWRVTETRTFATDGYWCLRLGAFNDLVSVATLKTDASGDGTFEVTWAASDYQLLTDDGSPNVNAGPEAKPYVQVRAVGTQTFPLSYGWTTARRDLVQIAGVWGWPAVPTAVRQACKLLAADLFNLRDAKFGATGIADLGIVRVGQNRKASMLLDAYRHLPVLVA